ncbi:MAG: acyltransferase [Acetatifactor sp.]|nr:acyltransferase [Acetatifactor sp.]
MLKFNSYLPRIFYKLNRVKYGKKLVLHGWPFVFRFSAAAIEIGSGCTINSGFFSNLLGLYHRTIVVARGNGRIKIGDNTGISGATIYAWEDIQIGNNCIIGANVKIFDTDFHPVDAEERLRGNRDAVKTRPVKIGNNVFIGVNSIILKGTELGNNCVVGAGSVVSGKFNDGEIIAGNPARVIAE